MAEAKALSLAWGVPLVGVNHLEAHLFASLLEQPDLGWPLVVLLVSGGHTLLIEVTGPGRYRLLGGTIDDAAGEAFDKVARFLGLGYPGGPAIDRHRRRGRPGRLRLPPGAARRRATTSPSAGSRPRWSTGCARSRTRRRPTWPPPSRQAVVDVLVARARRAAADVGARAVCLAGGVAANSLLRREVEQACAEDGIGAFLPSRALCTDNAAMVAAAGWWRLRHGGPSPLDPRRRPEPAPGLDRLRRPGRRGRIVPGGDRWHSGDPVAKPDRAGYR